MSRAVRAMGIILTLEVPALTLAAAVVFAPAPLAE